MVIRLLIIDFTLKKIKRKFQLVKKPFLPQREDEKGLTFLKELFPANDTLF